VGDNKSADCANVQALSAQHPINQKRTKRESWFMQKFQKILIAITGFTARL